MTCHVTGFLLLTEANKSIQYVVDIRKSMLAVSNYKPVLSVLLQDVCILVQTVMNSR